MAQIYGIALDPASFVLIVMTVVGASIGSPSTPGVGIVILSGILASIGIPAEGVAILLGVDRLLDMCRTAVNVSGDLTACVVMQRWIGDDVQETTVAQSNPLIDFGQREDGDT
jgi:Na+/H+-dicarboxylate symporter